MAAQHTEHEVESQHDGDSRAHAPHQIAGSENGNLVEGDYGEERDNEGQ